MPKNYITLKSGKIQHLDPNFDPDDWENEQLRKYPMMKGSLTDFRDELDITRDESMMNDVLDSLKTKPSELFERLMRIETQAADLVYDSNTGEIKNSDGSAVQEGTERRLRKQVEKLMVIRNPELDQFPEFARKAILERV